MALRTSLTVAFAIVACSRAETRHAGSQTAQTDTGGLSLAYQSARTDTVVRHCLEGSAPMRISEDSIGSLELGGSLKTLRVACPAAYETISYGRETASAAVAFPFDGLTAVAVQDEDSVLPDQPADKWRVTGSNGLLLGRLPLTAPWAQLQSVLGPAIGDGADGLTVMFCAHPRLLFVLDASEESVAPDQPSDLSRIPSGARIRELLILPQANPTWHC
jgi:hypothetical protein